MHKQRENLVQCQELEKVRGRPALGLPQPLLRAELGGGVSCTGSEMPPGLMSWEALSQLIQPEPQFPHLYNGHNSLLLQSDSEGSKDINDADVPFKKSYVW